MQFHSSDKYSQESKSFRRRIIASVVLMALFSIIIIIRLAYLQVDENSVYSKQATDNEFRYLPIAPTRGLIVDRNGQLLAKNIPVSSLEINILHNKNIKKTINKLQQLLPISFRQIRAFKHELKDHPGSTSIPIIVKLTPREIAKFSVNQWRFPYVNIKAHLIRYYPFGKLDQAVVGYVGRIDGQELKNVDQKNYQATHFIGKTGIEAYFEKQLHGIVGYQQVEVNSDGHVVKKLKHTAPIPGDKIVLTIDNGLNKVALNALGNTDGAAIAIQPSTGAVLALVSNPSYNPNLFVLGISNKNYRRLADSPNQPLFNRAIRGLYAPGSTIKLYYSLEALSQHVTTANTKIYDPGYYKFGGHTFWSWNRSGFGWIGMQKAIVVSDDTYFYHLAVLNGIKRVDHVLSEFGFGKLTHIELPGELPGVVPTPKWKLSTIGQPWYTGDTINTGLGQGYLLVTPLQTAMAVATIAERGKRFQPHLLDKIIEPNGNVIVQQPKEITNIHIPKQDWKIVIKAMEKMITSPIGTGGLFGHHPPYTVAGKTGTAQVYSESKYSKYNRFDLPKLDRADSLFVAFAPVKDPKIAIAVVAEHSDIASIVARKMLDYYLIGAKKHRETS